MRVVRIFLQALLLLLYALLLPVLLKSPIDWKPFFGVTIFFLFVLLLTVLLREHTESRINPHRPSSQRPIGLFIGFAGSGLCFFAYHLASGGELSSSRRGRFLASIIELIGVWPPAIVMFLLGAQLLYISLKILQAKKR